MLSFWGAPEYPLFVCQYKNDTSSHSDLAFSTAPYMHSLKLLIKLVLRFWTMYKI